MSVSRFEDLQNVNLKDLLAPGAHVVTYGITGSGKTTILLWLCKEYYRAEEMVVWRDARTLEAFSLLGWIPLKLHLPHGCSVSLEHPHLEHSSFDPKDLRGLFNAFDPLKVNVIMFDYFCFDDEVRLIFWRNFFHTLWDWKSSTRKRIKAKIALIIDEFSFICPGGKRDQVAGQSKLSNSIYQSMVSFRKWRLRLVASSHLPNDVHYGVRQQFSFRIFKKLPRQAVPERFWMYAHHFAGLQIYEAIIEDRDYKFNKVKKTPFWIAPRETVLVRKGEVKREQVVDEEDSPRKSAQRWRKRAVDAAVLLMKRGILETFKAVADFWKIDPSYAWKLLKSSGEPPEEDEEAQEGEAPPEKAPPQEEEEVPPVSRFSIMPEGDES